MIHDLKKMKKTSVKINPLPKAHALYFAPWFKWGLPAVFMLAIAIALVIVSLQKTRLEARSIFGILSNTELGTEFSRHRLTNNDTTTPLYLLLDDDLVFIGKLTQTGIQTLAGPEPKSSMKPRLITNLFAPSFSLNRIRDATNLIFGINPVTSYFLGLNGNPDLVVGISLTRFKSNLKTFLFQTFAIVLVIIFTVYGFAQWLLWRYLSQPLNALVETINSFSVDPTIARPLPNYVAQSREFSVAANAVEQMQRNTLIALRQRERLADIGEAVTKINHDIRNVLSSATLVTDALMASNDPKVRRSAPHVVRSLEQAVDLCQSMLDYLIETPSPKPSNINMQQLIDELQTATGMDVIYDGPDSIYADSGMLSRVFLNLGRNAAIAGATKLKIDIWRAGRLGVIDILDNGPRVDESACSTIFQAFRTSKSGGTGLGLAIACDLAVSHGGNLKLTRASTEGSEFRLHLPDQIFENADAA